MFAKINHVAIVSEKYALITNSTKPYSDVPVQDSPKSALTVGDGYVGLNINPRKRGVRQALDHFGIQVEDVETAFDRMRQNIPADWVQRPRRAVRRHHRQRSGRQCVRYLRRRT
jgi:hypothetical protein